MVREGVKKKRREDNTNSGLFHPLVPSTPHGEGSVDLKRCGKKLRGMDRNG